MSKQTHTPELDDDDQPFDQDAYFRKLGFPAKEPGRTHNPGLSFHPSETMLEVRPASQWITRGRSNRPGSRELFGPLWKEGEVAVLLGGSGTGKSLLAVHIAEEIATGAQASLLATVRITAQPVLYFDFELTTQQFTERYTAPSPIPGKLPIRRRFKFHRAAINWDGDIPPEFKGDLDEYLLHSIRQEILSSGASVVIIDNISYLARNISSNAACTRIMKTLKLWAATHSLSILVIAHAKNRRVSTTCGSGWGSSPSSPGQNHLRERVGSLSSLLHIVISAPRGRSASRRPLTLDNTAAPRSMTDLADSVFAIAHSTYGPEYRYVKHLKSRTAAPLPADDVLTFQLNSAPCQNHLRERVGSPSSPPGLGVVAAATPLLPEEGWPRFADGVVGADGVVENSSNPHSAIRDPQSQGPFLSLTHLGPSAESDHLRDYAREALDAERQEKERLRKLRSRSSRATLIDGILDGTYARYLKE